MQRLSHKIYLLSFWAMISVVIIHSKALSGNPSSWNVFIQWLFTRSLSKWAVPFFFAVSGFWFEKSLETGRSTFEIYLKKARTLLMPYLFWTVIGTILCLPLICLNNHIMSRSLLERTFLDNSTFWKCADALFGVTNHAPIGHAVLWYVRTLLIFFLLTPAWRLLSRHMPSALSVVAVIFVIVPGCRIPVLAVYTDWIGWILIGMVVERFSLYRNTVPILVTMVLGGMALILSLGEASWQVGWLPNSSLRLWCKSLIPCFSVPFVWAMSDHFKSSDRELPQWMKMTFWCYCVHTVFTSYFIASIFYLFGKSDTVLILTMLANVPFGLGASIFSGLIIRKISPWLFALLTGGRG